ncbi:DNA-methyltransferase [Salisaeta longa]|uniref:DNA-methyltransferase n=1 Tax=Salisaeta longa TaxID=503170 RepID=UPI0003B54017|nr:site-specific DNA-methyltransferase [Salisaeta longa]
MTTRTTVHFADARSMTDVADESVALVVTSPPYPMIEMWDPAFCVLSDVVGAAFEAEAYDTAFDAMHEVLRTVWAECYRALMPGGVLCINIGDATRSFNGSFRRFPNHTRTTEQCRTLGFRVLPSILWHKPTNKPTKFMGAGMLGLNAYVTLEHEHILIFQKGSPRALHERRPRRESAYFWEERNRWFSDLWTDLKGTEQTLPRRYRALRARSGAFPMALPYRLIEMFSVYDDLVLDPFIGTGTTALAAAATRRHCIGYEIQSAFRPVVRETVQRACLESLRRNRARLARHQAFVEQRWAAGKHLKHRNAHYDLPVVARDEQYIRRYDVTAVDEDLDADTYTFHYRPHRLAQSADAA